jgi:endonuclease G
MGTGAGSSASSEAAADRDEGAAALEKQLRFDPDYAQREGYERDFLGVEIALPGIVAARKPEMLKGPGNRVLVLRYHHYSLAMNQDRRFQMWSAVNVDYSAAARVHAQKREAFGTDHWVLDPRIPESLQVQDAEFYKPATRIDRGHVVRRDDSCWGSTFTATEYANSDTFHWTNCTPQHERFNQSKQAGLWGGLEDVIKSRAEDGIERLSIFAGPVLADDDPDAYGIRYPVRFWKVVAAIVDGSLAAYGFVLDQSAVIDQFGLEGIDFGKFTVHQRPLAEIESLTGVRLAQVLRNADVMLGHESILVESRERVVHAGARVR